jgi:hypothetical protein
MGDVYAHNSFGVFLVGKDIFLYSDNNNEKVYIFLLNDTNCQKIIENQIPITQKLSTDNIYSSTDNPISFSTEITTDSISVKMTEYEKSTESTTITTESTTVKTESTTIKTESTTIKTDIPTTTNSDIITQSIIEENTHNDITIESTEIESDSSLHEISSSIQTSQFSEDDQNYSKKEKCKKSSKESSKYDLCTECNNEKGFFEAELPNNNNGFKECYNNNTKPINFYFDFDKKYKICYETCLTCDKGGDEFTNNCILCDKSHIKRPETEGTTNCVTQCTNPYYYTHYGQYKCSNTSYCPKEFNLYIKELNKCTDDCNRENYKYQYGGNCVNQCPENSYQNENNICLDDRFLYKN